MITASIFQTVKDASPITNVPELLGLQHSNPIGVPEWLVVGLAFALAVVITVVNYGIRYREKSGRYRWLYVLMGLEAVVLGYYCFWYAGQAKVTLGEVNVMLLASVVGATFMIWTLITALMQSVAQLSVDAGLTEGKPWKEWKIAVHILNLGALVTSILYFFVPVASSWALIATVVLLVAFCIYKIVADSLRFRNWGWGLLIGVVFLLVSMVCLMLTLDVLRRCIYVALFVVAILVGARARQKKIKK